MSGQPFPWSPDDSRPIHFMGVGGAGMCALAEALVRQGFRVTGCDLRPGESVRRLESLGVTVETGHDPGHLKGAGGLVVSAAVPADHPEVQAASETGIRVLKRAEALGRWVNQGQVLAVSGTHGKTTTTALLTQVMEAAGRSPTGFVGGEVSGWESHLRPGEDDWFVVEADEYDRSFHHLHPWVAVVTNVEADHLDIYESLQGVEEGFRTFLGQVDPSGAVVVCADDEGAGRVAQGLPVTTVTYGFSAGSMIRGQELEVRDGGTRFRVREQGGDSGHLIVPMPGRHNALNALAAAAAARSLGVQWSDIQAGIASFQGVRRRFQRLGDPHGITVVDDYAHHPSELQATLAAARGAFPGRRLVAVFQPHLYSRTRDQAHAFGEALTLADRIWVTGIYPAREAPIPGVDGALVARKTQEAGAGSVRHHEELATLGEALAQDLESGDVCLLMGAGSIESVGPELVQRLTDGAWAHPRGDGHG
jgi:UDP-N-acetylmuramate--alanine ligase